MYSKQFLTLILSMLRQLGHPKKVRSVLFDLFDNVTQLCVYVLMLWSFLSLQTFLTLSLSDMANRVQLNSPREAEQYILHMVRPLSIFL